MVERSVQFSPVTQSCPTLCDPMDCSTPGFPVLYHLPEFAQIDVHSVGDAIQPSHPPIIPFSSCLQSLPASGSFPTSLFFTYICMDVYTQWGVCYSALKRKEMLTHTTTWLNLEEIMLSEISHSQKDNSSMIPLM